MQYGSDIRCEWETELVPVNLRRPVIFNPLKRKLFSFEMATATATASASSSSSSLGETGYEARMNVARFIVDTFIDETSLERQEWFVESPMESRANLVALVRSYRMRRKPNTHYSATHLPGICQCGNLLAGDSYIKAYYNKKQRQQQQQQQQQRTTKDDGRL